MSLPTRVEVCVLLVSPLFVYLLGSAALAHVPHQVLLAGAIPMTETVDQPWVIVLFDEDAVGLYRSLDMGQTWQAVWGEPMQDTIIGGTYTRGGQAALMGEDRYWYSDDGASWTAVDVPFTVNASWSPIAGGDQIYFAAEDGIWAATPGEEATLMLGGTPMASVFAGSGGPTALAADGGVYHFTSSRWPRIEPPPDELLDSATATMTDVYVGTDSGRVYRWDGKVWNTCADLPLVREAGEHQEVTRLASEGQRVYGVHAKIGVFWTGDQCATWASSKAPLVNYFEEDSGESFTTPSKAFTFLGRSGDRLYTGGYDGIAVLTEGADWLHPKLIGGDYTRGVAYSNSFNADGELLLAAYGSGVAASLDGGATFAAPGIGVTDANVQTVYVPDNVPGMELAYATFNRVLHRSYDQGATWEKMDGPFVALRQFYLGDGDRMWGGDVQSDSAPPNAVLRSSDAGGSWQEVTNLPASFGDDIVFRAYDHGGWICLNTMLAAACSADDGASWTDAYAVADSKDRIHDVVGWPQGVPERFLLGETNGIFKLDGRGGVVQVWDAGTAAIRRLAVADDGTLFAGDESGRLLRSDDGGDTWADTGVEFPCQIKTIDPRPDFATWGELIVGGMDGTFLVHDGALQRFGAYQRVDDVTEYVRCAGCVLTADPLAAIGAYRPVGSLQSLLTDVRGHTIRVYGRSDGTQLGELLVDGVVVWSDIVPATDGFDLLVEAGGLVDEWHSVVFTVLSDGVVDLDGVAGIGDSDPMAGAFDGTVDADGDGYDSSVDCDDADPGAYPGATEIPDDGIDQDCSGGDDVTGDTGDTGAGNDDTGDGKDGGCGCASGAGPDGLAGFALVAGVLATRRRSRVA